MIGQACASPTDSLKVCLALHALVRQSAPDPLQRYVFASTLVALIRSRIRLLRSVGWMFHAPCLAEGTGKTLLWSVLAATLSGNAQALQSRQQDQFWAAVQGTQAYADAMVRAQQHCSAPFGRGVNYTDLRCQLRRVSPDRVLVFHHYDQRGILPETWLEALSAAQKAGWMVLFSTSDLEPRAAQRLEELGIVLAKRHNIGLCLGAYKDLALLLASAPSVLGGVQSLVLANDSNLLVRSPSVWLDQLQDWHSSGQATSKPVLAGLTDSAQRACYHLQSFCLHANHALLMHLAWQRFWTGFSVAGSKDDLINRGEIGLSQAMLAAGVGLKPVYPLVQALLEHQGMAEELRRYNIFQPRHVNQSLFAWQSLLDRGFPLVKKHVLFELIENQGLPIAMAELSQWIPPERLPLLTTDLQELFISRYSGRSPEMG